MIFLTVGTQVHFDRLTEMVDRWAGENPAEEVIGQIGEKGYQPKHIKASASMPPQEYREYFKNAEFVIAHAGTGVTLTAAEFSVPLLMMARQAKLHEMRNDHQVEYMEYFREHPGIYPINNEEEFRAVLAQRGNLEPVKAFPGNSEGLVGAIRDFIWA